ncbi:MAG: hypothetical protein HY980_03955 [Candidatus Magasanikbacteria bacterium]|nr:hypothetical protein [Candidatus Magasanikbacteria bacterium]
MENQDTQKIIKILEEHGKKFDEHEELLHFICEQIPTFATKEDLKAFATKEDLKAFATKEDLKAFATKEDLKAFATKEDLKNGFREVENQLSGIKVELAGIGKELEDIKLSLKKLEKKTQEDDDAMIFEIEKLKKRVMVLEECLKVRQTQAA